MTKAQKTFFEQIELEEEDVKRGLLTSYANGLLDEDEKDSVQRAVDITNDEWELDPEATYRMEWVASLESRICTS